MIRRPPRSTLDRSSAASDVYKRQLLYAVKLILRMNKIEKFIKFGSLLIGILSFQIGFSQENYILGYVIRNNSDTLFGLVDYRDWANNPDKILSLIHISEPTRPY